MADQIATAHGDVYEVLERTRIGEPLRVQHAEPFMRGSLVEAMMNSALAMRQVHVEVIAALPAGLRRFIRPADPFWTDRQDAPAYDTLRSRIPHPATLADRRATGR